MALDETLKRSLHRSEVCGEFDNGVAAPAQTEQPK
jgi:hypothetical protein